MLHKLFFKELPNCLVTQKFYYIINNNDKLENIKCNTLVIADKTDKLFGLALVNETKNLPNFEYYIYDGFNHAPYDLSLDFPNRLKEFLLK